MIITSDLMSEGHFLLLQCIICLFFLTIKYLWYLDASVHNRNG